MNTIRNTFRNDLRRYLLPSAPKASPLRRGVGGEAVVAGVRFFLLLFLLAFSACSDVFDTDSFQGFVCNVRKHLLHEFSRNRLRDS